MNNYQAQQFWNDVSGIIGFSTSVIFLGFMVGIAKDLIGGTCSQSISPTNLKRLREVTTKVRKSDYSLESMAERGKLLDEIVNGKQRMMAIYLFDANHWLEKAGEACDEAIEAPSSEDESYEGLALSHLDESLSYYNTCYRNGWITEAEFKDMERYINELVVFIENHDWEKACGRVGDADRLAKIILADRLKKV